MNYGFGDITSYYAFCKWDGCDYVTDDYPRESAAEYDILEHLREEHDDDGFS